MCIQRQTNAIIFLLTRFNLLIFNKDKEGQKVRTSQWLEHRFELFERYCLPSVAKQTCGDFTWIVLFDSTTPERFKGRIAGYQAQCPQLVPVFVEPEKGKYFAQIFREEVSFRVKPGMTEEEPTLVLTTYLDNDDALEVRFVEDLQHRAQSLPDGTFIYYTDGYQFFNDHKYLMRIHYPKNHFVSVVERGDPAGVKTIYGYGSHYYIDKIKGARIEYVKDLPMWCQVVHDKNMGNDAYFLKAKMVQNEYLLKSAFGVEESVSFGLGLYLFRFLPRYFKTLIRRVGYKLFGRHW